MIRMFSSIKEFFYRTPIKPAKTHQLFAIAKSGSIVTEKR